MKTTFIHTADWQVGKPFLVVEDQEKRAKLKAERIAAIQRLGDVINQHKVDFVVVAGDLFDSPTPTKPIVSSVLNAIGELKIPVYVISGNHDYAGPGSLWEREFFVQEKAIRAKNLNVIMSNNPIVLEKAILFPCPLMRRHEPEDVTTWLRHCDFSGLSDDKARIVIAHGSVLNIQEGGGGGEDESELAGNNIIDINRLPIEHFDYVALGDWHGTKRINAKTWYSGTHVQDRFAKGEDYNPGNILVVKTERGGEPPLVTIQKSSRIKWKELDKQITDVSLLEQLENEINEEFSNDMFSGLLKLNLSGSLGLEAQYKLDSILERVSARLIHFKVNNGISLIPTQEELEQTIINNDNPLISAVAEKLFKIKTDKEEEIASIALKKLYSLIKSS